MCSMMAMQMEGGLGYDDLNELMKVRKIKISASKNFHSYCVYFFLLSFAKNAFFRHFHKVFENSCFVVLTGAKTLGVYS